MEKVDGWRKCNNFTLRQMLLELPNEGELNELTNGLEETAYIILKGKS
jgi:hypothetical protein